MRRNLPTPLSGVVRRDLIHVLNPRAAELVGLSELVIHVESKELNAREFGAYLRFADSAFGRVTTGDLHEYAQQPYAQLKIAELRFGSAELIIQGGGGFDAENIVILWLLLRFVPHAARAAGSFLAQSARAYRDYEEGRLTRARRTELETRDVRDESTGNRAHLRSALRQDPRLRALGNSRTAELARLLDDVYTREHRRLPAAGRFAIQYVRRLVLRIDGEEVPEEPAAGTGPSAEYRAGDR